MKDFYQNKICILTLILVVIWFSYGRIAKAKEGTVVGDVLNTVVNVVVAAGEAVVGVVANVVGTVVEVVTGNDALKIWGRDAMTDANCRMDDVSSLTWTSPTSTACPKLRVGIYGNGSGTVSGDGINCPGDCSETITYRGPRISLSANPGPNSYFTGWSGACSGTGGCVFSIETTDVDVGANFNLFVYNLSVGKAGNGSGVITGNGINCGTTCSVSYNVGNVVTLSATADAGSIFTGWSGACSGTGACTITMDDTKNITATFNQLFNLTVLKSGSGTGKVTGEGIDCDNDCNEVFAGAEAVALTATPLGDSVFTGWSGACSGTGACTITMDDNKTVTANFNLYKITVNVFTSKKGEVTSSPSGIMCGTDCIEVFTVPTAVTLTAKANPGYVFKSWEGCVPLADEPYKCTLNVNTVKSVKANFVMLQIQEVAP